MAQTEDRQEFVRDLLLTIPTFQDWMMIDWMILGLWAYAVLSPIRSHPRTLFLIAIVEFLWGAYDVCIQEYAQSIPFFFYSLTTLNHFLHPRLEKQK